MRNEVKGLCSICCVSYNHARFIQSCLETIWSQSTNAIEIIALDDGSSDGSADLLQSLKDKSPFPMTVIAQSNSGNIGRNFNTALAQATGEYVMFISLDDGLYPTAISEKTQLMNANPDLAFVSNSKITGISDDGALLDTVPPMAVDTMPNVTINDLLSLELDQFGSFYIQGALFRTDLIRQIGGFDEDMIGDDIVLRTRVFRYIKSNPKYSFKILNTPACYYRMHDNNIHKNSYRQVKTVVTYLDKYWPDAKTPSTLRGWVRHTVKYSDYKSACRVFFIGPRTAKYLLDPSVLMRFIKRSLKEFTYLVFKSKH